MPPILFGGSDEFVKIVSILMEIGKTSERVSSRSVTPRMIHNMFQIPTCSVSTPPMPGFLVHGGEMGALINAMDWRQTSLGPLEGWPPVLQSTLATLLSCPHPMFVAWGPELVFLFNDPYRSLMGDRFEGATGRPFAEIWPEIWSDLEPIVNSALGGLASSYKNKLLTLTRNGYAEPTWWSFSYMPLRGANGVVGGIYGICSETTEQVLLGQRVAMEQKRSAFWGELGDALRDAVSPDELMATASEKLGLYLQVGCVGYAEVDVSGESCRICHDWTDGSSVSMAGTHWLDNYGAAMVAQLRAGRTVAVNDTAADLLTASAAVAYASVGKGAFIGAPLIRNNRLAVIFFVINSHPRLWTHDEKTLVEDVAERTWISLQRLRAELDLHHMNRELDQRTTELLRSEAALRQSQKLETLGQLTGGVAHDFNNLLAVISSSVELLRAEKLPVEQRGRYLDLIFDTVGRAVKLTGQLLAFARQQPLRLEVFDVDLHVQGVVDLVRPLMGAQVQIHFEPCAKKDCFALADINQFETALVNLAVNARDAMNAKGHLTIELQRRNTVPAGPGRDSRSGDFVAISVADTGCGIADENLDLIFEPFYTTKDVGKGTGLGLSQVFGFAKQSGGEVEVRSELDRGSVFTLYLSCAKSGQAPEPLVAAPEPGLHTHSIEVLVVEDNETLAYTTCEILNTLGYLTTWAPDAAAALALLANGHYDLVFSDVIMPGMDGIEFGELVRKRYTGLPVVLTSGCSAVMAEQCGQGFEMVLKPYTSDALMRVFHKAIAEQAAPPHTANWHGAQLALDVIPSSGVSSDTR